MPKPSEYITEHQIKFSIQGTPTEPGVFDIVCITAGDANGWTFPSDVLKNSLSLWDGVHCFVDHAWFSRSVRDLAGQISDPFWDDDLQGVRATLKSFGPAGRLLSEFGREVLSDPSHPRVGFSADILFKASNNVLREILKVISLDLVYDPARGGSFLRALNQSDYGGFNMPKPITPPVVPDPELTPPTADEPLAPFTAQLQEDQAAIKSLLDEQKRQAELDRIASEARETRLQMCSYLLDSGLGASKLPAPVQDRIRSQFKDKVFTAKELQDSIDDNRQMLSELSASSSVLGPGRISSVFNEADKLQAAVDDLFGLPREEQFANVSVPHLSGIRELYLMLTGDHDLHGGYHPDRVQLATTADFAGLVKNALNKMIINTWDALGRAGYDWWQNISSVEHFNTLHDVTGTLIGTVGDLPAVSEGDPYSELVIGDSPETASFTKYGGYIPLTLELIDRDETRKLKAYARELASAGLRKISKLVSAIFTANAGIGPLMADTGNLFNAVAQTTLGGHKNLLTTALDDTSWDAACQAVYSQPMLVKQADTYYGTGPAMAVNPKFLLVPRTLQKTAFQILQGTFVREATYVYDNVLKGSGVPLVVPEWTDPTDWAAACDPAIAPSIFVGERFGILPEIFVAGDELSPAVFMSDEHRLKVRHFLAVWVNDFRPLHKNNVADG